MKTKVLSFLVALAVLFSACSQEVFDEAGEAGEAKFFVTKKDCRQQLEVIHGKPAFDALDYEALTKWFKPGVKVEVAEGVNFEGRGKLFDQIWLTIDEDAEPGWVVIAVFDGFKSTYHFKVNTTDQCAAGQFNLGMYGVIHVKYDFEPIAVAEEWKLYFMEDVEGWGFVYLQEVKTSADINWQAVYAAYDGNSNFGDAVTPETVIGWKTNYGAEFDGPTPTIDFASILAAYEGETHNPYHELRMFLTPVLDDTQDPFVNDITVTFPDMKGVTVQYYSNVAGWQTVSGVFDDVATFSIPEEHWATSGRTGVQVQKGGSYYSFWIDEGGVYPVPIITLNVYGVASTGSLGVAQGDWVYPSAPAIVGGSNFFKLFDNGTPYRVSYAKDGFNTVVREPVPAPAQFADQWDLQVFFGPSFIYQHRVPAGFTNVWGSSNDWFVRGANEGEWIHYVCDVGNVQDAVMTFVYNGQDYKIDVKLDGSDPFSLVTQNVTIVQTIWGGNYNFIATNLFHPNMPKEEWTIDPTAWNYEIISRPGTEGGAAPQVNTGLINTGLFVFSPQAVPTEESREGVYVIVATEKGGPGFKVFTVTVK